MIGENQRMCPSSDSIWSGAVPVCQCKQLVLHMYDYMCVCVFLVVDCGHPGVPLNGSSNFSSTVLDATVRHFCDSGYVLCDGNKDRICQPNMSWSGSFPDCISKFTIHFNIH